MANADTEQMVLDLTTHYAGSLSEWEEKFVENVQEVIENFSVYSVSEKQHAKVKEIFAKIDGE